MAANETPTTSTAGSVDLSDSRYEIKKQPVCLLVLGMAGSGKTEFCKKLSQYNIDVFRPYSINLDPACKDTPYHAHIGSFHTQNNIAKFSAVNIYTSHYLTHTDIRDTVNYKEVMKQYKLGPNGGIVTALNLFSTKFGKVIDLIETAGKNHKFCIIDTPG